MMERNVVTPQSKVLEHQTWLDLRYLSSLGKMNLSKLLQSITLLAALATASNTRAEILLTDNFKSTGSPKTTELNDNLEGRQTGTLATQSWTKYDSDFGTQIGNAGEDIGQPGGKSNGDFLLLANTGKASLEGLPLSAANVDGPLLISFDMFNGQKNVDDGSWTAFTMTNRVGEGWGWGASGFPQVPGSNEFGFRKLGNGTGAIIYIGGVGETAVKISGDKISFLLTDSDGTGSAFSGHGSKVTLMNGQTKIGTYALPQDMKASYITFSANAGQIGGIDNLRIETVSPSRPQGK